MRISRFLASLALALASSKSLAAVDYITFAACGNYSELPGAVMLLQIDASNAKCALEAAATEVNAYLATSDADVAAVAASVAPGKVLLHERGLSTAEVIARANVAIRLKNKQERTRNGEFIWRIAPADAMSQVVQHFAWRLY